MLFQRTRAQLLGSPQPTTVWALGDPALSCALYRCTRTHALMYTHVCSHTNIYILILKPPYKSQTISQLLTPTIPAEGVSCCCIRLRLEQTRPAESLEPALKWGWQNLRRASTMLYTSSRVGEGSSWSHWAHGISIRRTTKYVSKVGLPQTLCKVK